MLSIGIVKSGADVHKYFTDKDNYYLTDKSELQESSMWYGKGAEKLGIKGEQVEEKLFLDLLEGRMPNGEQIGIMKDGTIKHRPATDITLSAPKSFSLMALVANDKRLHTVMENAVKVTYEKIESMYAEARVTENKITTYEKTNNLVMALFPHTTSRELDAQFHVHGVILNTTQREDGAWRALSSRHKGDIENIDHGFRENIYANQHYLGMVFMSELAKGTVDAGYDIRIKDKHGNFEIVGLAQDYIDSQSKRRQQVLHALNESGFTGAKAAQYATVNSRNDKEVTELDVIREYWVKDAKKYNVDLQSIMDKSYANLDKGAVGSGESKGNVQSSDALPVISQNAKDAINDSLAHLSQYDVQIRHGDIIRQAFIFGGGALDHEQLESVLTDKLQSGELIGKENHYYTTKELVATEKNLKQNFSDSKGISYSKKTYQSGVIAQTLRSKDRLQVVDVKGFKNEAKLLDNFVKKSESQGLNVFVVHQNQSRLNRLDGLVDRDNQGFWNAIRNHFKHELMTTTGKFLHDYENKVNQGSFFDFFTGKKEDLVIITDAQKLSYQDGEKIEQLTRLGKAKVVFLNNTESTKGFQAGNFVKLLKESGVDNHRSNTAKKDTLVEISPSKRTGEDIAKHYVSAHQQAINNKDQTDNKNIAVVAYTNKSQNEMTRHIRDELQKQGGLSLQEVAFDTISTKGLSDIEKTKLKCYQVGDLVTFKEKVNNSDRVSYQSYFVVGFDKDNNQLLLEKTRDFKAQRNQSNQNITSKKATITFNPSSQINQSNQNTKNSSDGLHNGADFEVKKKQSLNIAVGEQLRSTRNLYLDQNNKIDNSAIIKPIISVDSNSIKLEKNTIFTVTAISNNQVTIQVNNEGNDRFTLSKEKLKHSFIDQGYVIKPHQLSKDIDHVLTGLSGYQVNQNAIGEVAEYANKVTLFTDNPDKSIKALDKESVNWVAHDVASGKVDYSYNPVVRTEKAIRKDLETVATALAEKSNLAGAKKHNAVETAVAFAMASVAEREAGFSRNDLLKSAMLYGIGEVAMSDIEKEVTAKEQRGEILSSESGMMTTPYVYELEKGVIANVEQGKNKVTPVFDKSPVIDDNLGLKQGQKDAIHLSLTTTDQFIGVDGKAGVGKTTMMKQLRIMAESKGYEIVGIAPTHKAVQALSGSMNKADNNNIAKQGENRLEKAGIPVMTAHKFVGQDMKQFNDKTIFIVDEVSMIGNRLYKDIQDKVIALNSRAIMTGDIGQQVSIEHGKPQELAMNNGMKTVTMAEIVRQDNEIMKKTAEYASQKDSANSLTNLENLNPQDYINRDSTYKNIDFDIGNHDQTKDRIKGNVDFKAMAGSFIEIGIDTEKHVDDKGVEQLREIWVTGENKDGEVKPLPSTENLFDAVANDYLSREKSQRDNTIVVACTHDFRHAIDTRVRQGLKQEGLISDEVNVQRLRSKNGVQADLLHAKNYDQGDIIRFDRTYAIAKKGDHMHVVGIKAKENKLEILNKADGNKYTINPAKYALTSDMAVFKEIDAELGKGDRIRLRMTDDTKGWVGGAEYQVKEINKGKALLENDKGQLLLNLKDKKEQLWDYAYTHTSYSAQGATAKHVIGVELNDNYRSNYITVTRAETHTSIYTLDKDWLIKHLTDAKKMQDADKVSAYEVMNKLTPNQEKQLKSKEVKAENLVKYEQAKQQEFNKHRNLANQKEQERKVNTNNQSSYTVREKPVMANDLKPLLISSIEDLAQDLLGDKNKAYSNDRALRYGQKGSFVVNRETGTWFSHETQEKGNVFDLIMREKNYHDFKDALAYAKTFLGYSPEMIIENKNSHNKTHKKIDLEAQNKKEEMYKYAKYLYDKSKPLKGTVGQTYLTKHRGLTNFDNANIYFLPSISAIDNQTDKKVYTPAILSFAKDEQGKFNHVQVVRLNKDGSKNNHVNINKQTYSSVNGYGIELNTKALENGNNKKVTYLAEGVETGLSILNVKKDAHVMAVLSVSNFKNINLNTVADKVVIALDNDFKLQGDIKDQKRLNDHLKSMASRSNQLKELVEHYRSHGKDVRFILPDQHDSDFNDILKSQGHGELSKQLSQLINETDYQKLTEKYIELQSKGETIDIDKLVKSVKSDSEQLINMADNIRENQSDIARLINSNKHELIKLHDSKGIDQLEDINKSIKDIDSNDKYLSGLKDKSEQYKDLYEKIKIDQVENLSKIPHQTKQGNQKGFER